MSVIIQIIILVHLCTVICYEIGQNVGLPSPSELTGGAPGQVSEVMVVSLLKCRSFIQIIIVGHLCTVICFEIGQINYGATLALRAYRRRAQDSEVKVVFLLKCRS